MYFEKVISRKAGRKRAEMLNGGGGYKYNTSQFFKELDPFIITMPLGLSH
jgi:hypothetical protein